MRFAARTAALTHSPIGAAHALVSQRTNERPLLDLSQAAPSFPTAPVVADRIAAVAREADGGRYTPQQGIPELLDAFAAELSTDYAGHVSAENVMITAGCNQAFCVVANALAAPGDSVVVVEPFYFNHQMWLQVEGIEVRHLGTEPGEMPSPDRLAALVDETTRALVLVTPGNPTGVTVDLDTIGAFATACRELGIVLIIDETYRTYRPTTEPAHQLFCVADWDDHVVSLHSFSKDLAIPGYRVGAVVGSPALITEAMKLFDCVAICAPRVGQEAVLAGLHHAGPWRREQVERIAATQRRFEAVMASKPADSSCSARVLTSDGSDTPRRVCQLPRSSGDWCSTTTS